MAFTYDLSTDLGKIRFRIGDTHQDDGPRPDNTNYSDEEITAVLLEQGSVGATVSFLLSVLSHEWSVVPDETIGPRSQKWSAVSKMLGDAAVSGANGSGAYTTFVTRFRRVDGYSSDAEE